MNMQWSNEQSLKLIRLYGQHTILWNSQDPHHYNIHKKIIVWKLIGNEMGLSMENCRQKMTNLLSSYRREKFKINSRNYESNWFAYNAFSFLKRRLQSGKSKTKISAPRIAATKTEGPIPPLVPLKQNEPVNRNKPSDNSILHQALTTLNTTLGVSSIANNDECGHFSNFVGNKLRKYSDKTRNALQFHISQLIFQADQGHYEQNDYLQSSTSSAFALYSPLHNSDSLTYFSPQPTSSITIHKASPSSHRSDSMENAYYSAQSPGSMED